MKIITIYKNGQSVSPLISPTPLKRIISSARFTKSISKHGKNQKTFTSAYRDTCKDMHIETHTDTNTYRDMHIQIQAHIEALTYRYKHI